MTRFWLVPGVSQTLHWVKRSASFDFLLIAEYLPVEPVVFTGVFVMTGGGGNEAGNLGDGGCDVISVLVDVATNIWGLESEAKSPSGRGIGFI